jgi:hypothetical protein
MIYRQDAIVRHQLFEAIYQEKFQILRKLILNIKLYLKFSRLIKQVEVIKLPLSLTNTNSPCRLNLIKI